MSKPYDATTKFLLEAYPSDWLSLLGLPVAPVEILDADLSTVTAAADRVFRPLTTPSYVLHLEPQAGYLAALDERTLFQNVALQEKYYWPVLSVLILLHRQANSPRFTGYLERKLPDGTPILQFYYRVLRVWELDAETILTGGLGTLPLAPLANVQENELPDVIRRIEERVEAELDPGEAGEFWTSTYVLMGLHFNPDMARELLKGVRAMKESATYQEILKEGEMRGEAKSEAKWQADARRLLLKIGSRQLGQPSIDAEEKVNAITDLVRLEALIERVLDVESWDELLAEPS